MRTILFAAVLCAGTLYSPSAQAKCFGFRGEKIKVCIDGDSSAIRKQAAGVCAKVVGKSSCSVSGTSGSCQKSSSVKCYDGDGKEHNKIDSDIQALSLPLGVKERFTL